MSAMGVKIDQFKIPVCNSFKPKIWNKQLCYEIDLNDFSPSKDNMRKQLEYGLAFLIDYNEDRESMSKKAMTLMTTFLINKVNENTGLVQRRHVDHNSPKNIHSHIYLNTIGR